MTVNFGWIETLTALATRWLDHATFSSQSLAKDHGSHVRTGQI